MATKYGFSKSLRELRIHFCQTGEGSSGIRSFLKTAYPVMKKHNPEIPILIREAGGIEARVFARYGFGKEQQRILEGLSVKEIESRIAELARDAA